MKDKIAIVSSYNTLCGNATYTEALAQEFNKHLETEIISVDFMLLSSHNALLNRKQTKHIKDLANQISKFKYINFQFEMGLFGNRTNILKNIITLIKACHGKIVFTIHRVEDLAQIQRYSVLRDFFIERKPIIKMLQTYRKSRYVSNLFNIILSELKNKDAEIIVHTKKAEKIIREGFRYDNVHSFPITFLDKKDRDFYQKNQKSSRQKLIKKYNLDPKKKYIGCFGFLTANKGHLVALKSLEHLPNDYNIIIFGSQHPQTIREYSFPSHKNKNDILVFSSNDDRMISSMIKLSVSLTNNVIFLKTKENDDFLNALNAVDIVAMPYFETGQNASGVASLALEMNKYIVTSDSVMFTELDHFYKNCFEMTTIGNYIELAQRCISKQDFTNNITKALKKYNIENNIKLHLELFNK